MIFATDPACKTHNPGKGHPEQPARYGELHIKNLRVEVK